MKTISMDQIGGKRLIDEHITPCKVCVDQPHIVSQQFSEHDIIWIQELFLTNGWHCLQLNDVRAGRSIINTMLYSLNYYHDVACLTIEDCPQLDSSCCDIYAELLEKGYLESDPYDVDAFFLEDFNADFLWIEKTAELIKSPWYQYFLLALQDLQMSNHMPVIIVSYK